MEGIVSQAVKKCPFLKKTPMEQIRKLSSMPASRAAGLVEMECSALTQLASLKCPMMKKAIKIQSSFISTSRTMFATTNTELGIPQIAAEKTFVQPQPGILRLTEGSAFDYESFYEQELDKKKTDRSYRYFNNINRLAQKFPHAHTGSGEHVTVWCSNDYLGMSKHPEVLENMK